MDVVAQPIDQQVVLDVRVPHKQLNPTAASLLGFLCRTEMTGWDLARHIEQTVGDFWNITPSQIYRELHTLERWGLVVGGEPGLRHRTSYSITEQGRDAFRRWILQEPGNDIVRSPLLLTVFFGADLPPGNLRRILALHQLRHEQRLQEYRAIAEEVRDGDPFLHAALAYGIAHEEAVVRWFASLSLRELGIDASASAIGGGGGRNDRVPLHSAVHP